MTYILGKNHYRVTICRIYSHMGYLQEALGTYSLEFRQPKSRQIHHRQGQRQAPRVQLQRMATYMRTKHEK